MKGKVIILGFIFGVAASSQASLTLLTNRGQVNANDTIEWGQFGVNGDAVPNTLNGTSDGGRLFSAVGPNVGGGMERLDEGTGWFGDFNPGDQLIWTQAPGTLTVYLDESVMAIGAQFEPDVYGDFTGHVEAFDLLGDDLGGFDLGGTVTANNDGSALFMGIRSSRANIGAIQFSTTNDTAGFAINQVSMQCCGVPEPASLIPLALGALVLLRRRRK